MGDVERTRLNHLKVLFLSGQTIRCCPEIWGREVFYRSATGHIFGEEDQRCHRGRKKNVYSEILPVYEFDETVRPIDPFMGESVRETERRFARLILCRICGGCFPGIAVQDEDARTLSKQELTGRGMAQYLAAGLRNRQQGISDSWKQLYSWYLSVEAAEKSIAERETEQATESGSRTGERSDHRSSGTDGTKRSGTSA